MVKRITLVRRRPELSRKEFTDCWLGEHAQLATHLGGLQEYTVDVVAEPEFGGASVDGIATLRFGSYEAAKRAFSERALVDELQRTRDSFAIAAEVFFVEEHRVDLGAGG